MSASIRPGAILLGRSGTRRWTSGSRWTTARTRVVGNSSQKVRQYLACGTPVVSLPTGSAFLEGERPGRVAISGDLDATERAVVPIVEMLGADEAGMARRIRSHAERNLSMERTLAERIALWTRAGLAGARPPAWRPQSPKSQDSPFR